MAAYISALVLLGIVIILISLQKTYYYFPAKELKRQARAGDREAAVLYRAVAYGGSLRLLVWLLIGLGVAASYSLLAVAAPGWLVFIAVAGLVWYAFAWSPNAGVTGLGARVALLVTPGVSWILYYSHPLLDGIARYVEHHRPVIFHTGLFEREDLIELVRNQKDLQDSRIPHAELDLVLHALSFGDKTVQSIMVPKRDVVAVQDGDVIGPILMDELYDSKHSRFPVQSAGGDGIVGVLYLRDLISAKHGGSVRDVMKTDLNFVHEDQTLQRVLHAFLATKHHLFVVIDSDEDYVGVITIEDVLEQVIGHRIEDDFDSYDDKRAVAAVGRQPHEGREVSPDGSDASGTDN